MELASSIHFWLDTLCVPLKPHASRVSAISLMKQTFEKATAVIAIDTELITQLLPDSLLEVYK
jgi:hypothetical protein